MRPTNHFLRTTALTLLFSLVIQLITPTISFALTSGPSQPEVESFEPVSTTDMVDVFTGDFTYNIPLLELPGPNGGYPFNLAYNSGITMDQEASWVGLGWNLNPGSIQRQMRGLPDEFDGQKITREMDIKPNVTFGVQAAVDIEVFGGDLTKKGTTGTLEVSQKVYYNNYKGLGTTVGVGFGISGKSDTHLSVMPSLRMDSQEGIGFNLSLSLSDHAKNTTNKYNIGVGYNSRQGFLGYSLATSKSAQHKLKSKSFRNRGSGFLGKKGVASIGSSSFYPTSYVAHTPMVSLPMAGRNVTIGVSFGADVSGVFAGGSISGFFSINYLRDKSLDFKAYGYNNLHNGQIETSPMLDFNREKDGVIRNTTPNLAMPQLTYDTYTANAQGLSAMFRPNRYDVAAVFDPYITSNAAGGQFDLEYGVPATGNVPGKVGGGLDVNFSENGSGKWGKTNNGGNNSGYDDMVPENTMPLYEDYYFKSTGEMTSDKTDVLDYAGGSEAVRVELEDDGHSINRRYKAKPTFNNGTVIKKHGFTKRRPRINNYNYIDNDPEKGMVVKNGEGTTYKFGQPVKNTQQVDCQFTCQFINNFNTPTVDIEEPGGKLKYNYPNTDKYYDRTSYKTEIKNSKDITGYAYSYLLTEVLGADYIDADGNGEANIGDIGYWVKFSYTAPTDYKWRTPYFGANLINPIKTTFEDNKGAYTYGEKKIVYLDKVETSTHEVKFTTSNRADARGASSERQNGGIDVSAGRTKKLDKIELFSKNDLITPIKTVNFEYSYELCGNTLNSTAETITDANVKGGNAGKGKLTLRKLYFTYQNNTRGSLSPYEFVYDKTQTDFSTASFAVKSTAENRDYSVMSADRWGYYKRPLSDNVSNLIDLPYVRQFDQANPTSTTFKTELDEDASVWNLKKIKLPSGAEMEVKYEIDDYAYVQNKTATQMFQITGINSNTNENIDHPRKAGADKRRVFFKLEKPILKVTTDASDDIQLAAYFEGIRELYFKVFMNVKGRTEDNFRDFVQGYVPIGNIGFDEGSVVGNNYTHAYVELGQIKIDNFQGGKSIPFHPFSVAAWNYLRFTNPKLMNNIDAEIDPNSSKSALANKFKGINLWGEFTKIFVGFHNYCRQKNWGERVVLDKSFIKLNSPDKIKYGGGCRVKEVVLKDNWNSTTSKPDSYYGQAYDYTTKDNNGRTISSGVATYEPIIGGDENALHYAKPYTDKIPLATNAALFVEMPVNEAYYPAASVGYSKVTVRSLATKYASTQETNTYGIPNKTSATGDINIRTTGAVVHEFYTAKDFPVISTETDIDQKRWNLFIPLPLVGMVQFHNLGASQGYCIKLNDMHGKVKKVTNYDNDSKGALSTEVSSVEYFYKSQEVKNAGDSYYKLTNLVEVLNEDNPYAGVTKTNMIMGQDHEFFVDMRESTSQDNNYGVQLNVDGIGFAIFSLPGFFPWPSAEYSSTSTRLIVTNKIIHQAGILDRIVAFDGQSKVTTKNVLFDKTTGQPVLTSTTNNFDDPIFSYAIPAYYAYKGMSEAYQNLGYQLEGTLAVNNVTNKLYDCTSSNDLTPIAVGDELLIRSTTGATTTYKALVYKKEAGKLTLYTKAPPSSLSGSFSFRVNNSGYKNILVGTSLDIKAKSDPTIGRF